MPNLREVEARAPARCPAAAVELRQEAEEVRRLIAVRELTLLLRQSFELIQRRGREPELPRVKRGRPDAEDEVAVAFGGELQEGPRLFLLGLRHRVDVQIIFRQRRQVRVKVDRGAPVCGEILP